MPSAMEAVCFGSWTSITGAKRPGARPRPYGPYPAVFGRYRYENSRTAPWKRQNTEPTTTMYALFGFCSAFNEHVFCGYRDKLPLVEQNDGADVALQSSITHDDPHEWYPNAPALRQLATYNEKHNAKDKVCSKSAPSSRFKMPGIFHFCCPHGICIGFSILHDHESPIHPFTTLFQRWRRTDAVRIVVMDNACNLHTYCLRREPWFFHSVWFLIDRLH